MKLPQFSMFPLALAGAAFSTPAPASAQSEPSHGPFAVPAATVLDDTLAFVENRGQWDPGIRFVAQREPMVARLERDGLVLWLRHHSRALVLKLVFDGASEEVVLEGEDQGPGVRNYFLGNDPEAWHTGVPAYTSVLYRGLYEGIDLRVRDLEGRLEYDLLLAPGADLSACVVRCEGVDGVRVEPDGSLLLETVHGPVRQTPPKTWYELPSGERRPVLCQFVARGESAYGFEIPQRDPELEVVIDPGLEWSTFLGGAGDDQPHDVAWNAETGHVVVGGRTLSVDFPTTMGAYDPTGNGGENAFIACLDPAQTGADQLVWSTYLGGGLRDRVMELELDEEGNVLLVGHTLSPTFPTTPGSYDASHNGDWDTFVAQLSADGTSLQYSTFLGGPGNDFGLVIAFDGGDMVTVGGPTTSSANFPVTPGALQPAYGGGERDCFVTRLALAGAGPLDLVYSTYLGGSSDEGAPNSNGFPFGNKAMAVATDASGCMYVTGLTYSGDFPVTGNAYQDSFNEGGDVFVCRIDPAGNGVFDLAYSTFLGSFGLEGPFGLAVDPSGVMVVGGFTLGGNYPTTQGAFQPSIGGSTDAFLSWLDPSLPSAQQLTYSTYVGTDKFEQLVNLSLDGRGGVVAGLVTSGLDFPTTCGAYDRTFNGVFDAAVIHLSPNGNGSSDLEYGTYIGGSEQDGLFLVLIEGGVAPRIAGIGLTESTNFPTTAGAFEPNFQGHIDAAVFILQLTPPPPSTYCVSLQNSAGTPALIDSNCNTSVACNGFEVRASGLSPNVSGIFYFGQNQVLTPFGDGFRCVGGQTFRLPITMADPSGMMTTALDFTSGNGTEINPGDTWNFQCWYRDAAAMMSGFNLSDGLKVVFGP